MTVEKRDDFCIDKVRFLVLVGFGLGNPVGGPVACLLR